jgi:hypothetical protein
MKEMSDESIWISLMLLRMIVIQELTSMLVLKECPADKAPKINVSRYLVVNQHALKCLRMILKGRLETNSAKPSSLFVAL